jgi:hypothetical protein
VFSRRALWSCLALGALSAGCAARPAGVHEVAVHQYVFGAFGGRAVDVRDVCGNQAVARLAIRRAALDYVLSIATVGIYLPHRVEVQCGKGPA